MSDLATAISLAKWEAWENEGDSESREENVMEAQIQLSAPEIPKTLLSPSDLLSQ